VSHRLPLFAGYGVELEYMIVDATTLDVRPRADILLRNPDGDVASEIDAGALAWSNELAAHVIELKTNGPAARLDGLAATFQHHVRRCNHLLHPHGLRLMPTAMHPWMDPHAELVLWPHEYGSVYEALHRIFDCTGHGWANLQSAHLNLPFDSDDAFRRLHAAVRLVLPIVPALAASSPIIDGARRPSLDTRLEVYRTNARRIPSLTGQVIPERVDSEAAYERTVLEPIYADMRPHDPAGVLRYEWINARGAIARFGRGTIEIRVTDVQEHPGADLAIAAAIVAVLQALVREEPSAFDAQHDIRMESLVEVLHTTTVDADHTVLRDRAYLDRLGFPGGGPCQAHELWRHLIGTHLARDPFHAEWSPALDVILDRGCLARRIVARLDGGVTRESIASVYGELCNALEAGVPFHGA